MIIGVIGVLAGLVVLFSSLALLPDRGGLPSLDAEAAARRSASERGRLPVALSTGPRPGFLDSSGALLGVAGRVMPASTVRGYEQLLLVSGNPWQISPSELAGLQMVALGAGAILGWLLGSIVGLFPALFALALAMGFWLLPLGWLSGAKGNRISEARRHFPEAVDLIIVGMSAGRTFPLAVQEAAGLMPAGGVAMQVHQVATELRAGTPMVNVLGDLRARLPEASVDGFARAVLQGESVGADILDTLRRQATSARVDYEGWIDKKSATLTQTLVVPMTALMLPALLIVLIAPQVAIFGKLL